MREADDQPALVPDDAFAALGHELRVQILRTYVEYLQETADGGHIEDPGIGFSALWKRSPIDRSSHFNYHFDQLVGVFFEQDGERYRLSPLGRQLVAALYRWTGPEDAGLGAEPVAVTGSCVDCGSAAIQASSADSHVIELECGACGNEIAASRVPPGIFEGRDSEETLEALAALNRSRMVLATAKVCPHCVGTMAAGITTDIPDSWGFDALPYYSCTRCHNRILPTFGDCLLFHERVRSFCLEHGIDPLATPFWSHEVVVSDRHTTIQSRDPWRVAVELQGEEATLTGVLDGNLDIVEVTIDTTTET